MADVHRADVLVRWVGLLPFLRGPAAPDQRPAPETPWQTGRRRPTRTAAADAVVDEPEAGERSEPATAVEPAEPLTPADRAEPDAAVDESEPVEHPDQPEPPARAEQQPPPLRLPVPGPPPVPAEAHALDLGRATPDPEPVPLVDPLLFRAFARSPTAPPAPPRDRRRGAVIDGIEHRPPVRPDPQIVGLSRRLRGRVGSRAFALVFVGIYLLILVQLIVALMNS
ncbi:hypothetical protein GCM10010472_30150 [Pseudonocardia halophobica]|uniref:Uncharacterized protein n=1 Tax=Pseudonocardia halophobica TaxID=29401 RepID=A0A9W6KZ33_9PSEU|nr:hypothetical protein [Pseudonocardia halophobica]GLL09274.1 hypothetical protein GCM10017577_04140 [Pseudonocardia halophobica]